MNMRQRCVIVLLAMIAFARGSDGVVRAETPTARAPAAEQESFVLADPALLVELVAAEPDVISPVAICWDADGAMYVAEMRDYPVGPAAGTIRRLTDKDGDGRYETATLFADKLNFPNGVLCVRDGLLVTAAPDLLFLRDRDGDGVADERRVVFTGFGEGNQQLRANGLCWGLDNWIYGANGRSDGVIRRPEDPADQGVSIRTRDFRFTPDFSRFEAVMGQSQFGQSRDDYGNRFLSWNTNPVRQMLFTEADVARNPHLASAAIHNLIDPGENGEVFPVSPRPQTFNRESTNHFNALAGLGIFRGDQLGEAYYGNAFVGESLSGLVHRRRLDPAGPTFVARRVEQGREFLAAKDSWFHPVFACTGPDGALYIADFYRRWVEHPQFVVGEWRDKVDWREGVGHGRIWRVRQRDNFARRKPHGTAAPTSQLVLQLESDNGWQRDTAQRLLVERADSAAVPLLIKQTRAPHARTAALALWTLDGLHAVDETVLLAVLAHPAAEVRRQALLLAAPRCQDSANLRAAVLGRAGVEKDSAVQFHLAKSLANLPGPEKIPALLTLGGDNDSPWLARAISVGAADVAGEFLQEIGKRPSTWLTHPTEAQTAALTQLAEIWGASRATTAREQCLRLVASGNGDSIEPGRLAIMAGAAQAWRAVADPSLAQDPRLVDVVDRASRFALDATTAADLRALAVRVVGDFGTPAQLAKLLPLATSNTSDATTEAAVLAICRRADAASVHSLLEAWSSYTPARRRSLSTAALESATATREFVEALEQQVIRAVEIDPAVRAAYGKVRDTDLARRATTIFEKAAPAPRDEVLDRYRPALDQAANRAHGASLFKAHCSTCHVMFGLGRQVGPDLSGIAARPKETLLGDVLDPSRQVAPDFLSYSLVTRDGRALTGILVSDTADAVTLRRGEGADDVVSRAEIEELQAAGKSLMPEGFEQRLSVQDIADLLGFLTLPERRLLEQP